MPVAQRDYAQRAVRCSCGGRQKMRSQIDRDPRSPRYSHHEYRVQCLSCGKAGEWQVTTTEAVADWNKRQASDAESG